MHRRRFLMASAASIVLVLGALAAPTVPAIAATGLCGSMAGQTPHITKVLWIVMENESYGTGSKAIPGSPSATYIDNSLLAQCGSTANYHGATHPSYPNYLALTSGSIQNHPSDSLAYFDVPSIFSQVDPSWRSYEEFMPTPCDHTFQTGTNPPSQYYLGRHNPAASYSALPLGAPSAGDCKNFDIPMGTTTSGALKSDVSQGTLPSFSFVTPGLCDDMHAVPTGDTSCPDTIKGGDTWLSTWIPLLTSGPDYTSGNLLIDITWDEGRGGTDGEDCINSQAADCIVPDIIISPYTPHVVSSMNYSHYSLLKTTEELLGKPLLGHAADASTNDMCGPFGICAPSGTAPTASFTSACTDLTCAVNGTGSTAPGSTITGYAWTFGDGGTGSGATASHTYAVSGTYPVTLTVTNAAGRTGSVTHNVTVSGGTPPPGIAYVGGSGVTKNSSTESVTIPSAVTAGDTLLLVATGVSTTAPSTPTGWSTVITEPNPVMTTVAWRKLATATDAGKTVTVTYPGTIKGSLQVLAYSGTSTTAPVAAATGAASHTTTSTATTPAVTVPTTGDWVVSYWTAKSSAVTAWTGPAGASVRNATIGSGGGQVSSLLADGGGPQNAGAAGGLGASTDQPFSAATTLSIVLAPGT
jgi:PKD repeat protein